MSDDGVQTYEVKCGEELTVEITSPGTIKIVAKRSPRPVMVTPSPVGLLQLVAQVDRLRPLVETEYQSMLDEWRLPASGPIAFEAVELDDEEVLGDVAVSIADLADRSDDATIVVILIDPGRPE